MLGSEDAINHEGLVVKALKGYEGHRVSYISQSTAMYTYADDIAIARGSIVDVCGLRDIPRTRLPAR
jgi:hypothetical protein